MNAFFYNIDRLLLMLVIVSFSLTVSSAQIGPGRFQKFAQETLTNTDTTIWTFTKTINDLNVYDYTLQINIDSVSGNTDATVYIEETMDETGATGWIRTTTLAVPAAKKQFLSGTVTGTRLRAWIRSSGTQSTRATGWLRIRQKKF